MASGGTARPAGPFRRRWIRCTPRAQRLRTGLGVFGTGADLRAEYLTPGRARLNAPLSCGTHAPAPVAGSIMNPSPWRNTLCRLRGDSVARTSSTPAIAMRWCDAASPAPCSAASPALPVPLHPAPGVAIERVPAGVRVGCRLGRRSAGRQLGWRHVLRLPGRRYRSATSRSSPPGHRPGLTARAARRGWPGRSTAPRVRPVRRDQLARRSSLAPALLQPPSGWQATSTSIPPTSNSMAPSPAPAGGRG